MKRTLQSPYRQLRPEERAIVDAIVSEMEDIAAQSERPLSAMLAQGFDLPPAIVAQDSKNLLERERVMNAVWERLTDIAREHDLTESRWFKEVRGIAFSSLAPFIRYDSEGNEYLSTQGCTPEELATISKITIKPGKMSERIPGSTTSAAQEIAIQLHPKNEMLKVLGEYGGYIRAENPTMRADRIIINGNTPDPGDQYQQMIEGDR